MCTFGGLGLVGDGVRAMTGHGGAPVWLKNHSEVSAQLKQTSSPLRPLTWDEVALYQEHTLPGIPFKNIFNR